LSKTNSILHLCKGEAEVHRMAALTATPSTLAAMRTNIDYTMKLIIFSLLLIYTSLAYGQVTVAKVDTAKLPKQIKCSGHITKAVTWKDELGTNYVLTTETGEYKTKDKEGGEYKNGALYVYHYITKGDSTKLLWRIYDYSKDCSFDVFVKFIDKAFKVTDLDKNGIAEVWVMYNNQCTSDVSPVPTKIIMYEGDKKYAVRGESRVQVSEKDFTGGRYTLDENFKSGNSLFRQFAISIWEKNKLQKL
jgi:hypothetical protein